MTNAETIKIINQYDCNFYWTDGGKIPTEDLIEAFELAVKALKAQEPRVLTLDETKRLWRGTAKILVERRDRPTIEEYSPGWMITHFTMLLTDNSWLNGQTYNKYWRCWSARPTDEQREAVPWME